MKRPKSHVESKTLFYEMIVDSEHEPSIYRVLSLLIIFVQDLVFVCSCYVSVWLCMVLEVLQNGLQSGPQNGLHFDANIVIVNTIFPLLV